MLRELHVRNLAVLAGVSLDLGGGFNVLSGETGAGKSIVVDSLALLGGARASSELIRTGADTLTVAGIFAPAGDAWRRVLAEAGVDAGPDAAPAPGELLVRREIQRSGRNRVYVNDQPTTLRTLGELAPHLLRIHGQREELGLVQPDLQRAWLDESGGAEAAGLLARVAAAYDRWAELARRLERASGDERARLERLDFLRFQAEEIEAVGLVAGEDDELRAERDLLRHHEAITHALGTSAEILFDEEGAATERLARAEELLAGIEAWHEEAGGWRAELEEARIQVEEVARSLGRRLDAIDVDPARLDDVEERLSAIERLGRKHGGGAAEILEARRRIGEEIEEIEGDTADRAELEAATAGALEEYRRAAVELSTRRAAWGEALVERVAAEIADLGLGKATLAVELAPRERAEAPLELDDRRIEPGREGIDRVSILFSANPGEEPLPLGRVASGGELSRLSLGLQLALVGRLGEARETEETSGGGLPVLVFDEVDSGIGGAQAAALGEKLRRLAAAGQILAVTHLPQVASYGHRHFRVAKQAVGGRTETAVEELAGDERVEELARMLGGREVTELSRSHARELLADAAAVDGGGEGRAKRRGGGKTGKGAAR